MFILRETMFSCYDVSTFVTYTPKHRSQTRRIMRNSFDYERFAQLCGRPPTMRKIMHAHNRIYSAIPTVALLDIITLKTSLIVYHSHQRTFTPIQFLSSQALKAAKRWQKLCMKQIDIGPTYAAPSQVKPRAPSIPIFWRSFVKRFAPSLK